MFHDDESIGFCDTIHNVPTTFASVNVEWPPFTHLLQFLKRLISADVLQYLCGVMVTLHGKSVSLHRPHFDSAARWITWLFTF